MVFVTLLPLGILQLWHSVNDGYFEARTLGYITEPGNALLEWMRMPGDLILIIGGVLPFLWITWLGIRFGIKATAHTSCRRRRCSSRSTPRPPRSTAYRSGRRRARAAAPRSRAAMLDHATRRRSRDRVLGLRVGMEVWLAAGYCVALSGSPTASTRWPAVRRRSTKGGRSGGFAYHEDHDAWLCPQDQWLWPTVVRPASNRVMRYRGTPVDLQRLPGQAQLHDLPSGREVQRAVDPLAGTRRPRRFHRGIACAVAVHRVCCCRSALRSPGRARSDLLVLVVAMVAALLRACRSGPHLRRTPAVFPSGMVHTLARRRSRRTEAARRRRGSAGARATDPTGVNRTGGRLVTVAIVIVVVVVLAALAVILAARDEGV